MTAKRGLSFCILLLLVLGMAWIASAEDSVQLRVTDGILYVQGQEFELADSYKPILIGTDSAGTVVLTVTAVDGTYKLILGKVSITLTGTAADYVQVTTLDGVSGSGGTGRSTPAAPAATPLPDSEYCPLCGKSNLHRMHICPLCNVYFCKHSPTACYGNANAVPAPLTTKDPDGKTIYHGVDESGSYVWGPPDGKAQKQFVPENFQNYK